MATASSSGELVPTARPPCLVGALGDPGGIGKGPAVRRGPSVDVWLSGSGCGQAQLVVSQEFLKLRSLARQEDCGISVQPLVQFPDFISAVHEQVDCPTLLGISILCMTDTDSISKYRVQSSQKLRGSASPIDHSLPLTGWFG